MIAILTFSECKKSSSGNFPNFLISFIDLTQYKKHILVKVFCFQVIVGWLVGWFYDMSFLDGLFNAKIRLFPINYIVSSI